MKKDRFEKEIFSHINGIKISPPANTWSKIDSKLSKKAGLLKGRRAIIGILSIAASILLVLLLQHNSTNDSLPIEMISISQDINRTIDSQKPTSLSDIAEQIRVEPELNEQKENRDLRTKSDVNNQPELEVELEVQFETESEPESKIETKIEIETKTDPKTKTEIDPNKEIEEIDRMIIERNLADLELRKRRERGKRESSRLEKKRREREQQRSDNNNKRDKEREIDKGLFALNLQAGAILNTSESGSAPNKLVQDLLPNGDGQTFSPALSKIQEQIMSAKVITIEKFTIGIKSDIALQVDIPIYKNLYISSGVHYLDTDINQVETEESTNNLETLKEYNLDYIEIPILAKYYLFNTKAMSLYTLIGVSGDLLVNHDLPDYTTPSTMNGAIHIGGGGAINITPLLYFGVEPKYRSLFRSPIETVDLKKGVFNLTFALGYRFKKMQKR